MSKYIDADKILKKIESRIGYFDQYYSDLIENIAELETCKEFINDEPTADVKPIVYDEWKIHKVYQGGIEEQWFQCPKCGWENALPIPRNFCPECGSRNFFKKGELI